MKRILSFFLCILMIMTTLPLSALAEGEQAALPPADAAAAAEGSAPEEPPEEPPAETATPEEPPVETVVPQEEATPSASPEDTPEPAYTETPAETEAAQPSDTPAPTDAQETAEEGTSRQYQSGEPVSVTDLAGLQAALEQETPPASITLTAAISIPAGTVVSVPSGVTLTVGATLSVSGTLTLASGAAMAMSAMTNVYSGGTLSALAGSTLTLGDGKWLYADGGTVNVAEDATFVFGADAKISQIGAAVITGIPHAYISYLAYVADEAGIRRLIAMEGYRTVDIKFSDREITLTQDLSIPAAHRLYPWGSSAGSTTCLNIPAGITVTVEPGGELCPSNLTVTGASTGIGRVKVQGTLINRGTVTVIGTLTLDGGAYKGNAARISGNGTVSQGVPSCPTGSATVSLMGITVLSDGAVLPINGAMQMTAELLPTDATSSTVTWSVVSGTGAATINSSGLLTGTAAGTVTVRAAAPESIGIYGEKEITVIADNSADFAFTVANGKATITRYTGAGGDVIIPNQLGGYPVTAIGGFSYCASLTSVVFPDSLETIASSAFLECRSLESAPLPDSVTTIGQGAFRHTALTNVTIPSGTTSIGRWAYFECYSLPNISVAASNPSYCSIDGILYNKAADVLIQCPAGKSKQNISIPESVKTIADGAFYGCSRLTGNLNIPDSVTTIEARAFSYCISLSGDLVIPSSVKTIGERAFECCRGFRGNLIISNGITTIGAGAFQYCIGLTGSLVLPNSITEIHAFAFSGCRGFTGSLILPNRITTINNGTFSGCSGFTGSLIIPDSVKTIGDSAFKNCIGFNGDLVLSKDLTSIANFAFQGCSKLTGDLKIPNGVTFIGQSAFYGCRGFNGSISLPASLEHMASFAFGRCPGIKGELVFPEKYTGGADGLYDPDYPREHMWQITSVRFLSATPAVNCIYNLRYLPSVRTVTVPEGTYAAYAPLLLPYISASTVIQEAGHEGDTSDFIINGTTLVAYRGTGGAVVIPEQVTAIGEAAFWGRTAVTSVRFPDGLLSIGANAFANCTGMRGNLYLPNGVETIGEKAFYGCSGLSGELSMGGVSAVANTAFGGCANIATLTFRSAEPTEACAIVAGSLAGLVTIRVPEDSASAYAAALSDYAAKLAPVSYSTAPSAFAVDAVSSRTVRLSWLPSASSAIVGYKLYRNGALVQTVQTAGFTDTGLTTGATYTYKVCGYTSDGAMSAFSELTATPVMPVIDSVYTAYEGTKVGLAKNTVYAKVLDSGNHTLGVQARFSYYDGTLWSDIGAARYDASVSGNGYAVYAVNWNNAGLAEGAYRTRFVFTDADAMQVSQEATLTIDHARPARIGSISAVSDTNSISLSWSISSEIGTARYRIYRKTTEETVFSLLANLSGRNTLTYTDTRVRQGSVYQYYVVGVNGDGAESLPSETAQTTPGTDTEKPIVTSVSPAGGTRISGAVTLRVAAQDNLGVTRTTLSVSADGGESWTPLAAYAQSGFAFVLDTADYADGELRIKAVAFDACNNESVPYIAAYYADNTGPERVTGVRAESTATAITLHWNNVAANDVRYFRVERKTGTDTYATVGDAHSTLGMQIDSLIPAQSYTYRVVGYDRAGNRGEPSADCTVTTANDTTAPTVTAITPHSGYYSAEIPVGLSVADDYSIASITLMVSTDLAHWSAAQTWNFNGVAAARSVTHSLDVTGYDEGYLYIAATATDAAGNAGLLDDDAPFVQHLIDRSAPAVPTGVRANGHAGCIEVSWTQGAESDLAGYNVYASDAADGVFARVASGIRKINYVDRTLQTGKTRHYKVTATDAAGNESAQSRMVFAQVAPDTLAPEITGMLPADGELLGDEYRAVRVAAKDNLALDSVTVSYKSGSMADYAQLLQASGISGAAWQEEIAVPIADLADGDTVSVRAQATDAAGNRSAAVMRTYTVDRIAPAVATASATADTSTVALTWTGRQEPDLIGYRIYRKGGADAAFRLIGQRAANASAAQYTLTDYDISAEAVSYVYRIDAVDGVGNCTGYTLPTVTLADRSMPKAVIRCESAMLKGAEYSFDATGSTDNTGIVSYAWDFGGGDTATGAELIRTFNETGNRTVTLTVADAQGNTDTASKVISVVDAMLLGQLQVTVKDGNGAAIPGASVYFDLGGDAPAVKTADYQGVASFTGTAGKYAVGAMMGTNTYLPVKKDAVVKAGETVNLTLVMVEQPVIEGGFAVEEMTFEELVAAGIDTKDAENRHYVSVSVTLAYGSEDIETNFIYDDVSGFLLSKPIIINCGGQDRRLYAVPCVEEGLYRYEEEMSVMIIDVPVDVVTLKSFFDVKLHVINNAAAEFSLLDNVFTLELPEGLQVVDSLVSQSSPQVSIMEIPGQTTRTIQWVVRGDAIGDYYISADYSGRLSQFNAPVSASFCTEDAISVLGMSGMELRVEVPEALDHGTFYYNTVLMNNGASDVNCPQVQTQDPIIASEYYRNDGDMQLISEYPNVLKPGEALITRYMCVSQTEYTELVYTLREFYTTLSEETGLELTVAVLPLADFTEKLLALNHAMSLAEGVFYQNSSAYEYLMTDDNYLYNALYNGRNGLELASEADEYRWSIIKLLAQGKDFDEISGRENSEQICALLLDMMGLNVAEATNPGYKTYLTFFEQAGEVAAALKGGEHGTDLSGQVGACIPDAFTGIFERYSFSTYRMMQEEGFHSYEDAMLYSFRQTSYFAGLSEASRKDAETEFIRQIREVFGADGFRAVWEAIGVAPDAAAILDDCAEDSLDDWYIYLQARSVQNDALDFLQILIDKTRHGDAYAARVHSVAVSLHALLRSEAHAHFLSVLTTADHDGFGYWKGNRADRTLDALMGKSPQAICASLKTAAKVTAFIGDALFNLSNRYDLADNIRYLAVMSDIMRASVLEQAEAFQAHADEETALALMKRICYLSTIRRVGESQFKQYAQTYEYLLSAEEGYALLQNVNTLYGTDCRSFQEWLDLAEDRISMARLTLVKDPEGVSPNAATGPAVSYNYQTQQTTQQFDAQYAYKLNGGEWIDCTGGAIFVSPAYMSQTLEVRRKEATGAQSETLTTRLLIAAIPSISEASGVTVAADENNTITVSGLDGEEAYEFALSNEATIPSAGTAIPSGSLSHVLSNRATYRYVYIRLVGNARHFTSKWRRFALQMTDIPVESVAVQSAAETLFVGETLQLSAAVLPESATDTTVVWSVSSITGAATIDENGLLTAVAAGTVTVRAAAYFDGAVYGEKRIAIRQPVTSVRVQSGTADVALNGTLRLRAAVMPANASNPAVQWSIQPASIATVDETGLVTGLAVGTATVRAAAVDGSEVFGELEIYVKEWMITVDGNGVTELTSGQTLRLTGAYAPPEHDAGAFDWSLREEDTPFAVLSSDGLLTAKTVTQRQEIRVTVRAQQEGPAAGGYTLWIVPRADGVTIRQNGAERAVAQTGQKMQTVSFDMRTGDNAMQLSASVQPSDAAQKVTWKSSAPKIAGVSADGLVTGVKPGTATITATAADGSRRFASVKVQVCYADTAARFTATSDDAPVPAIGLQEGQTTRMRVFGADRETPLDAELFTYSISPLQSAIATVNAAGVITAGSRAGNVTVTAALNGDPLKRKATLSVKVIPLQTERVLLTPVLPLDAPYEEVPYEYTMFDSDGEVTTNAQQAESYAVYLNKSDIGTGILGCTFTITSAAIMTDGTTNDAPQLTYQSSDNSVATVVQRSGGVRVMVKRAMLAVGACTISGTSKDLTRAQGYLSLYVRDFEPRMDATKIVMNARLSQKVSFPVAESYGNSIESVSIHEWNASRVGYDDAPSERLTVSYENGLLHVGHIGEIKNGVIRTQLRFSCANGSVYPLPLMIQIKNVTPSITVKQAGKFNLFYRNSEAVITAKAGALAVTNVAFDSESFTSVSQSVAGVPAACVRYKETPVFDARGNAIVKGTVFVSIEGYSEPVEKPYTLQASAGKPSFVLSPAASVINLQSENRSTEFAIYDKASGAFVDLSAGCVEDVTASRFVTLGSDYAERDAITLTLNNDAGGTVQLRVQPEAWMQPLTFAHRISVSRSTTPPTAKLGTSTLQLSNIYTSTTAGTPILLNQANWTVHAVEIASVAQEGTAARRESDKLTVAYVRGTNAITVRINDGETPKAGAYAFRITPKLSNGTALNTLPLTVKVSAAAPRASLIASTLHLNCTIPGETAMSAFKLNVKEGYVVTGVRVVRAQGNPLSDGDIAFGFHSALSAVTARLNADVPNGTYSYVLTPLATNIALSQEAALSPIVLRLRVYRSARISAAVSASGKLDTADASSAITYAITKLMNAAGIVSDVTLSGADADRFTATLNEQRNEKGQQTVTLRMRPNVTYRTDRTYRIQLGFSLQNVNAVTVLTPELNVRVSQSALSLASTPASASLFQSQGEDATIQYTIRCKSAAGARIANVTLDPSLPQAVRLAMGDDAAYRVTVADDGSFAVVKLRFRDTSRLKANARYSIPLLVAPQGCAENVTPAKITVKLEVFR